MLIISVGVNAQQLVINSTTYYGGSGGERIERVIPTSDGGFLAVGSTNSNDGNIPPHPNYAINKSNVLVTKHDSLGALQWVGNFGGSETEFALGAAQTTDGGFAVIGITTSNDGDVTGRIDTSNTQNLVDIWLLKLDAAGTLKWKRTYGTRLSDAGIDVLATPDGGMLMLGSVAIADSDAAIHIGPSLYADWLLIKTDSLGNRQWRQVIGGTNSEVEYSRLFHAPGGGYYLVGNSGSHDSDLQADNLWLGNVQPTNGPVFLKISDSGRIEWCKRYGGDGYQEVRDAIWDYRDSSLVAVGYTDANNYYFSGNHLNPIGQPSEDVYVVKVNKDGEYVHSQLYGTARIEHGYTIALHPSGGYMVGGLAAYGDFPVQPPYVGGSELLLYRIEGDWTLTASKMVGTVPNDYARGLLYRNGRWLFISNVGTPSLPEGATGAGGHPQGNLAVSTVDFWPASVNERAGKGNGVLQLAPNPAGNEVLCRLPNVMSGVVQLYSADGKHLLEKRFRNETEILLPLKGLSPGNYTVQVQERGGMHYNASLVVR